MLSEAFGLQGPEAYSYTSKSNTLSVSSIDDVKDFAETIVSGLNHAAPVISSIPSLTVTPLHRRR
jgi:hypothetical protein